MNYSIAMNFNIKKKNKSKGFDYGSEKEELANQKD